ncbi:MAG: GGDEF domain-containing protein [Phycisphaerae bacterium]
MAEESVSPRAPRLASQDERDARERCDVSGFDPQDPKDKPAPAEEVFKRQPTKESKGWQDRKRSLEGEPESGRPVIERLPTAAGSTPKAPSSGADAASLKISLQAQIDILDMMRAGKPGVMQAALQILQNNFRWNGILRIESHDAEAEPTAVNKLMAAIFDGTTTTQVGGEKSRPSQWLTLETTGHSARVVEQLRQAAVWLSSIAAAAKQTEHLRRLADTDELSGAYNRRYFLQKVPEIIDLARRKRFCVSLLLFDIDDFKHYNDNFGHAAGDAIIREVIHLLRRCTRSNDLVARIGGDEFAVVFGDDGSQRQPDSQHPRTVFAMAQRFRKAVAEHPWNTEGGPIAGRLSISGGLATFPWDAQSLNDLMAVADAELMKAKSMGKNAIVLANPQTEET